MSLSVLSSKIVSTHTDDTIDTNKHDTHFYTTHHLHDVLFRVVRIGLHIMLTMPMIKRQSKCHMPLFEVKQLESSLW